MVAAFAPEDPYYRAGEISMNVSGPDHVSMLDGNDVSHVASNFTKVSLEVRDDQYASIGMPPVHQWDAMQKVLGDSNHTQKIALPNNKRSSYQVYSSKTGAQLWGAVHSDNRSHHFGGFVPHYNGSSRVQVAVLSIKGQQTDGRMSSTSVLNGALFGVVDCDGTAIDFIQKEIETTGELALHKMVMKTDQGMVLAGPGYVNPGTNEAAVAFRFSCPNYGFLPQDLSLLHSTVTIQLTGFAREIRTHDTEEEYYEKIRKVEAKEPEENRGNNFASQFFGPGDFMATAAQPDTNASSESMLAVVAGKVLQTELKTNELTGEPFYWALLETACGMQIDVVIREHLLVGALQKPPRVGGVVVGGFWLSGLLIDEA